MLMIQRMDTETWRDAVARVGEYLGIAWELLNLYDRLVASGLEPKEAARRTAYDWNCIAYIRES